MCNSKQEMMKKKNIKNIIMIVWEVHCKLRHLKSCEH